MSLSIILSVHNFLIFAVLCGLFCPPKNPESSLFPLFMTLFLIVKLSDKDFASTFGAKQSLSLSRNMLYISSGWIASPILSRTPVKLIEY